MQSLFLTQYIKSNIFVRDLREKLSEHDVNFDLIVSDINYDDCPCLLINSNTKPQNVSLINSWKDAINVSKHPLIILNELNLNYISPIFDLINEKSNVTIINVHAGLWSYGKKISPEINDLEILPHWSNCFEPIDLENLRNILRQGWKQYIRLLHKEMPSAIFDVEELGIIDAELLENLNSISLKTYGFAWNDWTILASGSLFATAIQTWEILQQKNKQLSIYILQLLNYQRNNEIIESIKNSKKLFILIDHKDSNYIKNVIDNRLHSLNLTDITVNIISPKYEKLTTVLNEYQEEQSHFNPDELSNRIISIL